MSKSSHGGARPNAGRKPKEFEVKVRDLSQTVLVERYGSHEAAILALLDSGDTKLIQWVYDQAYGKPSDKVEHTGAVQMTPLIIQRKNEAAE